MKFLRVVLLTLPPALWLLAVGHNVSLKIVVGWVAVIDASWVFAYVAGAIVWIRNPDDMPLVGKLLLILAALLQLATLTAV